MIGAGRTFHDGGGSPVEEAAGTDSHSHTQSRDRCADTLSQAEAGLDRPPREGQARPSARQVTRNRRQ